jgi:hypothetical protein
LDSITPVTPPEREQEDEAERPQHRHAELIEPPHMVAIQEKIFTPVGNRDHHGGEHEVGLRVDAHAGRIHVVAQTMKPMKPIATIGVGHAEIAEHRLPGEGRDDVADHAEAGQDQDVDLGVAEEPEQVLVEQRVAAAGRRKNVVPKLRSVSSMVMAPASTGSDSSSRKAVHQHAPHEQRHLVQRHAGRAHVEDGGDEVDGAEDRRRARRGAATGWRSPSPGRDGPASTAAHRSSSRRRRRAARRPSTNIEVSSSANEAGSSQNEMLFMRGKAMSGAPIMQRHEPVAEAADHGRHHHEEHHDQAVAGDEHVEHVAVWRNTAGPALQLHAHRTDRKPPIRPADDREQQVHRADVLVVRRIQPPPHPIGRVLVVMIVRVFRVSLVGRHVAYLRNPFRAAPRFSCAHACRCRPRALPSYLSPRNLLLVPPARGPRRMISRALRRPWPSAPPPSR